MDKELKSRAKINSFYIVVLYVGLGTLTFFINVEQGNDFLGGLLAIVGILTLPATFISWIFFYSGGDKVIMLVIGIQLVFFFIFWLIVYRYMLNKYTQEERIANKEQDES